MRNRKGGDQEPDLRTCDQRIWKAQEHKDPSDPEYWIKVWFLSTGSLLKAYFNGNDYYQVVFGCLHSIQVG
jgi:hypothetical protein